MGIKWPKAVFSFTAHINLSKAALKIHFMSSKHISSLFYTFVMLMFTDLTLLFI